MRVLVCGGRNFHDKGLVFAVLDKFKPDWIISGGARGADSLAEQWARERNVGLSIYPAQWHVHGSAAGPIRNQEMLDLGEPDLVLAFPGGRGTANMISLAQKAGVLAMKITS